MERQDGNKKFMRGSHTPSKMKKSVAEVVFLRARADFMISRTGEVSRRTALKQNDSALQLAHGRVCILFSF
jgi:hypothetical protein